MTCGGVCVCVCVNDDEQSVNRVRCVHIVNVTILYCAAVKKKRNGEAKCVLYLFFPSAPYNKTTSGLS